MHRVAISGLDLVIVDTDHERLGCLGDTET